LKISQMLTMVMMLLEKGNSKNFKKPTFVDLGNCDMTTMGAYISPSVYDMSPRREYISPSVYDMSPRRAYMGLIVYVIGNCICNSGY